MMIKKILKYSIAHPFKILVFTLITAIYGGYSFYQLPIDAVPDITNNQVQINTLLAGFSPEQMEKQITYVIETTLAGIPGLQMTRSLSRNSFSQVTAIFDDNVDIYFARQQINEKLNEAKNHLPEGAEPSMGPISTGLGEIYMWSVAFQHPEGLNVHFNLKTAVQDAKAMQDFDSESLLMGAEHSQKVKAAPIKSDYESKDDVDLASSTAVFRFNPGKPGWQEKGIYLTPEGTLLTNEIEKASYLRIVQDWMIKPQLKSIQGLAGVDSIGGYLRQYHVEPELEKMIAFNLTFHDIIHALNENNISIGPGYIEKGGESLLIKSDERLNSLESIESIIIANRGRRSIYLRDIAQVKIGKEMRSGSATENGQEAVIGTALMLIGANSRIVSEAVDAKIQEINQNLPPDIIAKSVLNRTKLVNATLHTVKKNLSEGAILVILILFAFLGHFRAALITALVIPLSMLLTAIGMVHTKISGNLMSLGAIDFGLIVDGAIIITENCLKNLAKKQHETGRLLTFKERCKTVFYASKEMIQPSVYGQAIIITVYFPILMLSGVEGKMFHPMAMTVIFALISAFILSLTFIPAMIALCVRGPLTEKENWLVSKLKSPYEHLFKKSLKFPWIVTSLTVLIVSLSFALFMHLGEEFIPTLDERDIAMHAMRIPSTSLTQSTDMQKKIEKQLIQLPEVAYVFSKTGTAEVASDPMPPNVSDTFIILNERDLWPDPQLPKTDLIEKIKTQLSSLVGNNYEFTQPIEMRFNELISGVRSDLAIKLYGDNYDILIKKGEEIAKVLSSLPGSADVKVEQVSGLPVLDISIDREKASLFELNVSNVLELLSAAMGGGKAGQMFEGDRRFDILVKLSDDIRQDIDALRRLPIPHPDEKSAHPVLLGEIANLDITDGLNEISRENSKRFISIESNVRGKDLGSFVDDAKNQISGRIAIPSGYWLSWGGQFENLISARNRLTLAIPLCFAIIFFFLYTAFHSLKSACLVFSGVPLALTGGIISLWLRDMPFSITAAVGFIALSGIAVLNGLVLVSSINQLEKKGKDPFTAVLEGTLNRFRPVLMTALVASLGFIPMALSTGTGAEVQKPLATVVIGGLITSTFLTLFVLPSLYLISPYALIAAFGPKRKLPRTND